MMSDKQASFSVTHAPEAPLAQSRQGMLGGPAPLQKSPHSAMQFMQAHPYQVSNSSAEVGGPLQMHSCVGLSIAPVPRGRSPQPPHGSTFSSQGIPPPPPEPPGPVVVVVVVVVFVSSSPQAAGTTKAIQQPANATTKCAFFIVYPSLVHGQPCTNIATIFLPQPGDVHFQLSASQRAHVRKV
jgi:hypothetical protein